MELRLDQQRCKSVHLVGSICVIYSVRAVTKPVSFAVRIAHHDDGSIEIRSDARSNRERESRARSRSRL
jgi:hypothetical protein